MAYAADKKPLELTELTSLATGDGFIVGDLSDASEVAKYITKANLLTDLQDETQTLTNKTIDANSNTVSNVVIGAECTGASTALTDTADLTYNADADVSANTWVIDEDNMVSDLASKVPTQQSVKAYVDAQSGGTPEGTAILSTAETVGKVLQADGDNTCSWVALGGGGDALVANPLSQFAATTSAQLAGVISDETGSGLLVFGTSPTLVTPALGTPSALVGTNITGTAASLTAGTVTTNANLTGHVTSTGNAAVLGSFTKAQLNTAISNGIALNDVVDDTTPTLGGELDAAANSIGFTMQTATGDGTTTVDWGLGNHMDFTFGAFNETFTFTAPTKSGVYTMSLKQDSVGSRTATWPATVKWPAGTAPTLTTTATTGYDVCSFRYDGTNYYAVATLNFS